ncbi:MAG: sulfurtransferase-like selenium metabolism protein YedF [Thermoanaerobacteraceae bacterium]|nr:sulfurtransferase-like selenium metabolism protein YedF [Thermoanaerobacteraceae bacterium]
MMRKEVDCRGMACPRPVLETKKALEQMTGGQLVVTVDNPVARENVTMFARNAGFPVTAEERDGLFVLTITKSETGDQTAAKPESLKETPADREQTRTLTYFFTSNILGQGAPDLGLTLIKSLLNTLAETNPAPDNLIFLNSGVFLTCDSSPVLEQLKKMEAAGARIISCGTCLEYYKLKEKLQVGRVSNMFEINQILSGPGKVITVP